MSNIRFSRLQRILFFTFNLCIGLVEAVPANAEQFSGSDEEIVSALVRAESFLNSFKNDSALKVVVPLLHELREAGSLDSRLGLRLRLVEAISLEQKQSGDSAIARILPILELSQSMKMWDVYIRSSLTMALIHEKVNKRDRSLYYLNLAGKSIKQYRLDRLYPYFAIRMASWQRIFGSKEEAIRYAGEALRYAPNYQLKLEEAIAHMLMSFLLPDDNAERLSHCFKAIALYNELGDHIGSSAMFHQASRIQQKNGNALLALEYSDSSIAAAKRAMVSGNEKHQLISSMYSFRGSIFKYLKNYDSAWFYMEKGHQVAIDLMQTNINSKIAEIDARYNTEKAQEEMKWQKKELSQRNLLLLAAIFIVLVLAFLLLNLYRNYRREQSAKKILEEQKKLIQHQADQLKNLDATKTRLFANISHELRTPLTLILGPINNLMNEIEGNEKQAKLLRMASQSGTELSNLINQILDLGKIDAGKMLVNKKSTQLATFIKTHLSHFESLASRKQISYLIRIDESAHLTALIDREKYRRILYNLLSNAFKFTQYRGLVEVSAQVNNDKLLLKVKDSGPGIHPQDIPHLFDRYFQSNRSDHLTSGGTGIGLAICKEYIYLLEGEISVASVPEEGALFTVTLPIEPASLEQEEEETEAAIILPWDTVFQTDKRASEEGRIKNTPTILLVEDNPGLQNYIRLILGAEYHVITAEHGRDALNKLASVHCDLVLSDLMMPVMDGYQLLQALKADDKTRGLPVILITARAEMDEKLKALRIGVDDYITKPFDEEELKARVKNLLLNFAARVEATQERLRLEKAPSLISVTDQAWLEKFEEYLLRNYRNDLLTVPELAHEFSVSESTLLRQLKRITGLTPVQYIQEVRLNQARFILENEAYDSLTQVALRVGYKDVRTFSRSFKNRFGKTPSELFAVD